MKFDDGFSDNSRRLNDSVTHGTKAEIIRLNTNLRLEDQVIDLSIGTIDLPTDRRIDDQTCDFIKQNAEIVHGFAPVRGFPFLLSAIAAKLKRMHCISFDPQTEIIVTPGGIKGALTLAFQTFVNAGDEVVVPVPNWPHYADMLALHGAIAKLVPSQECKKAGINVPDLEANITDRTKLIILGDCINPTGKVYTSEELRQLAQLIATHNVRRSKTIKNPIRVIFDCPYEAHVCGQRPVTFAAIDVNVPGYGTYSVRHCTATLSGPGKSYGMHGDRIGYICAPPDVIEMMARVQVNTNSFAATYGQVATYFAVQEEMDEVIFERTRHARANLNSTLQRLTAIGALKIDPPDGGYFLFVDFSNYADLYTELGYERADLFLLAEARVATISGCFFVDRSDSLKDSVRINCGRSIALLSQACSRIENALRRLEKDHRRSVSQIAEPGFSKVVRAVGGKH